MALRKKGFSGYEIKCEHLGVTKSSHCVESTRNCEMSDQTFVYALPLDKSCIYNPKQKQPPPDET